MTAAEERVREVTQEAVKLLLRAIEQVAAGPFDERQVRVVPALILVVLQHHRREIHAGQHVAEAGRQVFFLLQVAAERQHRDVDDERERRAESHDVLVIARRRPGDRRAREARIASSP